MLRDILGSPVPGHDDIREPQEGRLTVAVFAEAASRGKTNSLLQPGIAFVANPSFRNGTRLYLEPVFLQTGCRAVVEG